MARSSTTITTPEPEAKILQMGTDLAAVLCKVIREVPILGKDQENRFANYAYVSIDKYYEQFARIAAKHGLTWITREAECDVVEVSVVAEGRGRARDEGPKIRTYVKTTYACDIYLAGVGVITDVGRVTIFHQLTGPQTAGSSASYAEKVFFRVMLKAVTGERDADAEPQVDMDKVQAAPNRDRRDERRERALPQQAQRGDEIPPDTIEEDDSAGDPDEPDERGNGHDRGPVLNEAAKAAIDRIDNNLPVVKRKQKDWTVVTAIFKAFMPTVGSYPDLREWWDMNEAALEIMKEDSPEDHAEILGLFKARRNQFPDNQKGT
jgi:hypothetical protein